MSLIVNFYGGPGCGKSSCAAGLFYMLKFKGINCELVTEYAKDKVWEKSTNTLNNQIYVFGKQLHRMWRLKDQVDVIITDSPLLLSIHYAEHNENCDLPSEALDNFINLVASIHNSMDNLDIILKRTKPYNPKGRLQTKEEAEKFDELIIDLVIRESNTITNGRLRHVIGDSAAPDFVADMVFDILGQD